jgi:hypothetical protein
MRCDNAQEFFSDYIEETLERPMVVALEAHFRACEACTQDLAALRRTWTALTALPVVEPPAEFARRVAARLAEEAWEQRKAGESPRSLWQGWLRSLTPAHGFGLAAIAALLAAGIAYPLWMPGPTTRFGPGLGAPELPTIARPQPGQPSAVADPTLAPRVAVKPARWDGARWVATAWITPGFDLPDSVVTAAPMMLVGDGDRLAGAQEVPLAKGAMLAGQPHRLPIPLEADALGAYTVKLQIASPVLGAEYQKMLFFPTSGGEAPGAVSLDLEGKDVNVALARLSAAARRPVIADAGLTGRVSVRLVSASPEQALSALLGPLGYHWRTTPDSFVVTRY